MVSEKSLAPGTVIKGVKHSYRVVGVLRSDGQGFTYKTVVSVCRSGSVVEVPVVVREQMMVRCSSRGADGMTVITPDDIAPTVNSCLEAFIRACRERINLSRGCPWIINVIETFHANNTYYYVVEYLDGDTLEEYVRDMGGRLTFEQTRKVLSPIFDAVIALHNHRAVHADIHPRHVRFVKREREKIPVLFSLYATMHFSDRGVMRWDLPPMTCEEGFAPPEQYNAIDHFCPQIDIYALASMVVFCLSGNILPDSRKLTEEMVR
ncbi:protein kinase, partial [uncultured Duncaniella sp.]